MLQAPLVATTIEAGETPLTSCGATRTGTPSSGTPNGSGGFTYQDLGVVNTSWQIAGNRRFQLELAKTASCGATRTGTSNSGTRTARGASPTTDLGVVNTSWQIAGNRRFQRQRRRRHPVAQYERGRRALEPEWLGGLHLREFGRRRHQLADPGNRRFHRQRRRRHPVAQYERGRRALEPEWLGRLYLRKFGRRRHQLADPRNRRFHRQRRETASSGATRQRGRRALELRTARGASPTRTWASSTPAWQIQGTGDFTGSGERQHPLAQHEPGCRALEPEWLGRLHLRKPGRCRRQLA